MKWKYSNPAILSGNAKSTYKFETASNTIVAATICLRGALIVLKYSEPNLSKSKKIVPDQITALITEARESNGEPSKHVTAAHSRGQ